MAGKFMKKRRVSLFVLLLALIALHSDSHLNTLIQNNPGILVDACGQEIVLQVPDTGTSNSYTDNMANFLSGVRTNASAVKINAATAPNNTSALYKINSGHFKKAYDIVTRNGVATTEEGRKEERLAVRSTAVALAMGGHPGYVPTDEAISDAENTFYVQQYKTAYRLLGRAPYDLVLRSGPDTKYSSICGIYTGQVMFVKAVCTRDYNGWLEVNILRETEDGKTIMVTGYTCLSVTEIKVVLDCNDCKKAMFLNKKTGEVVLEGDPRVDEIVAMPAEARAGVWVLVIDVFGVYPNGKADDAAYMAYIYRLSDETGQEIEVLLLLIPDPYANSSEARKAAVV